MQTIRVRAVPGALVPHPSGRARTYVGYRPAKDSETPVHVFGRSSAGLVLDGVVEVPRTSTIDRAIARGELITESATAPAKTAARAAKTEA